MKIEGRRVIAIYQPKPPDNKSATSDVKNHFFNALKQFDNKGTLQAKIKEFRLLDWLK